MFNFRAYPFLRVLIPLVLGIVLHLLYPAGNLIFFLSTLTILLLSSLFLYRIKGKLWAIKTFYISSFSFFMIFGYALTFFKIEINSPTHFHHYLKENTAQTWIGTIKEMPVKKKDKWKTAIEIESVLTESDTTAPQLIGCTGKLLIYLTDDSTKNIPRYGDRIAFVATPQGIRRSQNPHTFNYPRYLFFKNIHHQAYVQSDKVNYLNRQNGHPIIQFAFDTRQKFLNYLEKYLRDPSTLGVGCALILGYKSHLTESIQNQYAGTGAMHVLAVSGLHVGLLFLILNTLFSVMPVNRRRWKVVKTITLIAAIWLFALLTGASPSVLRASTMFTFVIIGMALQRSNNIYNSIAASACLLLWYNPLLLMDVGFQLSYCAVTGIVYFQPKIAAWWLIENKIGNYLWQLVAVSIAAQLATLPLSLYYFHQFPIYFWLSGLVVVPAAGIILSGGLILFVLETLIPGFGKGVGWALDTLISFVNYLIEMIYQLPFSMIRGIWIEEYMVIAMYIGILCYAGMRSTRYWRYPMIGMGALAIAMALTAYKGWQQTGQQQFVVYDVYRHTAIDVVQGRNLVSFTDSLISKKTISFAAQNNRWQMGILNEQYYTLADIESSLSKNEVELFEVAGQRIGILSEDLTGSLSTIADSLDYLIVRNGADLKAELSLNNLPIKRIILDSSNPPYLVDKWQKACADRFIETWSTAQDGAFVANY